LIYFSFDRPSQPQQLVHVVTEVGQRSMVVRTTNSHLDLFQQSLYGVNKFNSCVYWANVNRNWGLGWISWSPVPLLLPSPPLPPSASPPHHHHYHWIHV
jgi:hypothetical protein